MRNPFSPIYLAFKLGKKLGPAEPVALHEKYMLGYKDGFADGERAHIKDHDHQWWLHPAYGGNYIGASDGLVAYNNEG